MDIHHGKHSTLAAVPILVPIVKFWIFLFKYLSWNFWANLIIAFSIFSIAIAFSEGTFTSTYPLIWLYQLNSYLLSNDFYKVQPGSAPQLPHARSAFLGIFNSHLWQFSRRPKPSFSNSSISTDL